MKKLGCFLLAIMLIGSVASCSSSSSDKKKKKQDYISLEPDPNDALQPIMTKLQANLDYLIYGLMNLDGSKIEKSVGNIITLSQYTAALPNYQHKGSSAEWEEFCTVQQNAVEDLKQNYLNQDYNAASSSLGDLLAVCVQCHKPYRF